MNQIVLVLKFLNKKEIFNKGKLYYNIEFAPIQKQIYVLEMFNKLNMYIYKIHCFDYVKSLSYKRSFSILY